MHSIHRSSTGLRRVGNVRHAAIAGACLALAIVTGCSSTRVAATSDAESVLRAIEAGYRSTPDMTIAGTVKVSGIGATVWFDALIRERDSMKITLVGPFGIALGAMSASSTGFEFYKADEDIVVVGEPDRRTFEKLLMIPLDYYELIALLRGEIPRVPSAGDYTVRADDGLLLYTVRGDMFVEEISVDPSLRAVQRYQRWRVPVTPSGAGRSDTLMEDITIAYSAFAAFGDRPLARRAVVDVAGGAQRITVTVDEVEPTIAADAAFGLDIPEGVERRRFRP